MSNKTKVFYEFEGYRLDVSGKCLWRDNELVGLTPKALETLTVLVLHRGAVVEKDSLLNEIWADTFVEEATLAQNISTLRKILGARPDRPFIETVPRRGYRFVASVNEVVADEGVFVFEKRSRTDITSKTGIINGDGDQIQEDEVSSKPIKDEVGIKPSKVSKAFAAKKISIIIGAATLFGLAATAGFLFLFSASPSRMADAQFQRIQFSNLASSNNIMRVSISPDSKYLAMVERRQNDWVLIVRQIGNSSVLEITSPAPSQFIGLTFSSDSQDIFYSVYPERAGAPQARYGKLYKISLLGGIPKEIKHDIDSAITISPENDAYAFVRNDFAHDSSQIVVARFNDDAERVLAGRGARSSYLCPAPAWSPDGKTIICSVRSSKRGISEELVAIDVETGNEIVLPTQFQWVGRASWLKDGSGVVFPAFPFDSSGLTDEIWAASFPEGKLRSITNGIGGFYGIGLSSDSSSLVAIKSVRSSNFWLRPIGATGGEEVRALRRGFSETSLVPQTFTWATARGILFDSTRNGNSDIWVIDPVSEKQTQLTNDEAAEYSPAAPPDGAFAVFLSNRGGGVNIWRMKLDGTEIRRLTDLTTNIDTVISTDGKWVYFSGRGEEDRFPVIWKAPADGGTPVRLTNTRGISPKVSPDGKFIACLCSGPDQQFGTKLSILSAETGTLLTQFENPQGATYGGFSWSADNRNIYVLQYKNGTSLLVKQPLNGGPVTQLIESRNDVVFRYAVSTDEQLLFYENGNNSSDVVMLTNMP